MSQTQNSTVGTALCLASFTQYISEIHSYSCTYWYKYLIFEMKKKEEEMQEVKYFD